MAGETTRRRWWLIIRRPGHAVQRIPVSIRVIRDQSDLNGIVDQSQISPDFEIIDEIDGMTDENRVASYELVSTIHNFEISYFE